MRGAGDGNRTRVASLEDWGSTIELRPRACRDSVSAARSSARGPESGHGLVTYRRVGQAGAGHWEGRARRQRARGRRWPLRRARRGPGLRPARLRRPLHPAPRRRSRCTPAATCATRATRTRWCRRRSCGCSSRCPSSRPSCRRWRTAAARSPTCASTATARRPAGRASSTLDGAPVEELRRRGRRATRSCAPRTPRSSAQALSQLSPLHRAALVKREIEEKSLPVIADELDVAEDSVKHLLFRARRALRKLLAGTSVAPGADAELPAALRPAARAGSGGVAALRSCSRCSASAADRTCASVPVVGVDLPDVLGVTAVADAVGGAGPRRRRGARPWGAGGGQRRRSGPGRAGQPLAGRNAGGPTGRRSRQRAGACRGSCAGPHVHRSRARRKRRPPDHRGQRRRRGARGERRAGTCRGCCRRSPAPARRLPAPRLPAPRPPAPRLPGTRPDAARGRPCPRRSGRRCRPSDVLCPPGRRSGPSCLRPRRPRGRASPDTSGRTDGAVPAGDRAAERAADAAEKAAKGAEQGR